MAPRKWIVVPKGTPVKVCRYCAQATYWVQVDSRFSMIDTDVTGGVTPDSLTEGRGVRHFTICSGERDD